MIKKIIALPLIFCIHILHAQDLHLTNYQANSPFFNPATSGSYLGIARVAASVRTQYEKTYQQGIFHADGNFFSPLNKKHWVNAGIQMIYDVAGSLKAGQTGGGLQSAYHIPLNEAGTSVISAGIQLAMYHYSYNSAAYSSETTLSGFSDPDLTSLNQFATNEFTMGAGTSFTSWFNDNTQLVLGLAMMNINKPSYKIIQNNAIKAYRYNLHAGLNRAIGSYFILSPSVYASFYEQFRNINLQVLSELKLSLDAKWALLSGVNYRIDESVSVLAGFKSKKIMVCFAADILNGASKATIANPGALELSAYYIFYKYTKPVINPMLLCPML
jgi:type IX secretion system PorP/SprF family membrane protein